MIFDRGVDVAHVEGHCQPAREGIEIAHVYLALPRKLQLPLEAGCELAHHHGDENKQNEVEHLMRVGDPQAVQRRIEEEGGGERAGDGGHHRRDHAPARGRNYHRNEVDDRTVVQAGLRHQAIDKGRDEPDQHQRQADVAQFSSQVVEFGRVWHCHAGRRPESFRAAQYTPADPCLSLISLLSRSCLSCPAWLHSGLFEQGFFRLFLSSGEVAERLNAPHSKCGIRATVSGVRIPPSPPKQPYAQIAHRAVLLGVAGDIEP